MIPNEADLGRWQAELAQISPRHEPLSYLSLRWEPGDDWEPIDRWIVWHILPNPRTIKDTHLRSVIQPELDGPHPRSTGRYDKDEGRWVHGPCRFIDRATWEVYRETGRYGRRWWVVQGSRGGHRHRLSETERTIWRTLTGTPDTPAPGDLPYAPFDNRTLDQLKGLDQMTRWLAVTSYGMKNVHQLDADERAEVTMAKQAISSWFERQMEEVADEYGSLLKKHADDLPDSELTPAMATSVMDEYHMN